MRIKNFAPRLVREKKKKKKLLSPKWRIGWDTVIDSFGACAAPLTMSPFLWLRVICAFPLSMYLFLCSAGWKIYFGIGDVDTVTGGVLEI